MPSDIKKAAFALIISCVATLIGVYFDGVRHADLGFDDPITLALNLIWVLIIAWVIWDLWRGTDIKLTLVLVGVIIALFLAYDIYEYGFYTAHIFYAIELIMFVFAWYLIKTESSRAWYAEQTSKKA